MDVRSCRGVSYYLLASTCCSDWFGCIKQITTYCMSVDGFSQSNSVLFYSTTSVQARTTCALARWENGIVQVHKHESEVASRHLKSNSHYKILYPSVLASFRPLLCCLQITSEVLQTHRAPRSLAKLHYRELELKCTTSP